MEKRVLGRSGIEVSPVGFGCWAIGGPCAGPSGNPIGWGEVDDAESARAIQRAVDLGVTFFDTADVYGAGHSERVLGQAIAAHRDEVTIATKWGYTFDEATRTLLGEDASVEYLHSAVRASLRRLDTDHIDLLQMHIEPPDREAAALRDACESLITDGLIRSYGWSTDDPAQAVLFAQGPGCAAVQHELSVLHDAPDMLAVAERADLASINRTVLAMGILGGRHNASTQLSGDDVRVKTPAWMVYYKDGTPVPEWLARVDAIRELLTADGRTLPQGALAWVWARSGRTIPIPGVRTVEQAEQNFGAMRHGPLTETQMSEIARVLA